MNAPPQKFGRYVLLGKIATGGMAEIFHAKLIGAEGFEKEIVIKKILPQWGTDRDFIAMLVDEAKIVVQLNHPNIVQVYELGCEEGDYYIAMEYVSGLDLKQILRQSPAQKITIPLGVSLTVISEILAGLAYAHSKEDVSKIPLEIVHRDISPQNILVGFDGRIKLTDFGIAKAAQRHQHTMTGVMKGKLAYMSPEQANSEAVDCRSDLFSLGVVLYEILTGEKLFEGDSDLETLEKVRRAPVSFSEEAELKIPQELREILFRSLNRDPHLRYVDAWAFREAIMTFAQIHEVELGADIVTNFIRQLPPNELTQKTRSFFLPLVGSFQKKHNRRWSLIALLVGMIGISLFLFFKGNRHEDDKKTPPVVLPLERSQSSKIVTKMKTIPKPMVVETPSVGYLSVQAIPWAYVMIDGKGPRETPLQELELSVGKHSIEVIYEPEEKKVSLSFELKENDKKLCLVNFKEDAQLRCD